MNVFEQRDVKPGDYVEFTIHRTSTFTDGDVVTSTNAYTTYKGVFGHVDGNYIVFQGGTKLFLGGNIRLDVLKRAESDREVGWYEVEAQTWRNNRVARYWTGDGWSLTTTGPGNSIEFDNIRFIGK